MKIALASDLHMEMNDVKFKNTEGADVLILAGDIFVSADLKEYNPDVSTSIDQIDSFLDDYRSYRIHNFFINCSKEFKNIILIAGNHENYRSNFDEVITDIKKKLRYITNLHILDKKSVTIGGVKFVGATLWTDMNGGCESSKEFIKRYMNDFRIIKKGARKFTPDDVIEEHNKTIDYFHKEITPEDKVVVITHHAPSSLSIADEYKDDELMNGGYYSDLDKFIKDRPNIRCFFHGHTHTRFDYTIGNTNIRCNPRGYRGEKSFDEFELEFIEI